jgi:predicted Zn-dependent peptidase
MVYIGWALPRGYDGEGYIQRFLANAVEHEGVQAALSESDVVRVTTTVVPGVHASTFLVEVHLGEGKNPEKSAERVLDQMVRLWDTGQNQSVNKERERRFLRLRGSALVRQAISGESLLNRSVARAAFFHRTGDPRSFAWDAKGIGQLRSSQFEHYVYEYLKRENARMVFVDPSSAPRETSDSGGRSLVFTGPDLNNFVVPPGALATYVHGTVLDLQTFTLDSGLEVILVRRPSAPTVTVTLAFRGGQSTVDPLGVPAFVEDFAAAHYPQFGRPGDFGASGKTWARQESTYVRYSGASGNLENMLSLMATLLQTLHIDESVRRWYKSYAEPSIVARERAYSQRAQREFLTAVYPGSPYGRTPVAADLDKLSSGDAQTWIDRTFRPSPAVLTLVGDIEFEAARRMVKEWLGSWGGKYQSMELPLDTLGEGGRVVVVERPGAKQTEIRMGCSVRASQAADLIAVDALGERMRRQMWELARSVLGGSYGFSGGGVWNREASYIEVRGAVDDRVLARALALARKELDELAELKISDVELGRLQWFLGIESNVAYQSNAALGSHLGWLRLANLPPDFLQRYPQLLASMTAADISRVAAACAKTTTLVLVGDPGVVQGALKATAR